MVADILENIGEGVEKVVTPVHNALDPKDTKGDSLAYYLGGTVVVFAVLVYAFRKKLFPKQVLRYRRYRYARKTGNYSQYRSMYSKRRKK